MLGSVRQKRVCLLDELLRLKLAHHVVALSHDPAVIVTATSQAGGGTPMR